jgi:Putative MetA-pathway of phenol degradation
MLRYPFSVAIFIVSGAVCADAPSFDRPGIAFSTETLPRGTWDWEQGLPDAVFDHQQGVDTTLYSAGTRIRIGLTSHLELQLAEGLYNHVRIRSGGITTTDSGTSDLSVGFKYALPSIGEDFSWAMLGAVSFDTGSAAFSVRTEQYSLAASASLKVNETNSLGFYAGAVNAGADMSYSVSPNFSWSLSDALTTYVEAGCTFGRRAHPNTVAGGGLAWMASKTIQLDLYGLQGVNAKSTQLQTGLGVSIFFP